MNNNNKNWRVWSKWRFWFWIDDILPYTLHNISSIALHTLPYYTFNMFYLLRALPYPYYYALLGLVGLLIVLSWWVGTIGGGMGFKSVMCIGLSQLLLLVLGVFWHSIDFYGFVWPLDWICLVAPTFDMQMDAPGRSRNLLLQLHSSIGNVQNSLFKVAILCPSRGHVKSKSVNLCGRFVWCPDKSYLNISISTFIYLSMHGNYSIFTLPIGSMYGRIFTYMYHKNQSNVGKYTIHGSYGLDNCVITISGISRGFTEDEFRQQPAPNRHPLSVSGARCAEALVWASVCFTEESSEMKDEAGFSCFFYAFFLFIWSVHSINRYKCCNAPQYYTTLSVLHSCDHQLGIRQRVWNGGLVKASKGNGFALSFLGVVNICLGFPWKTSQKSGVFEGKLDGPGWFLVVWWFLRFLFVAGTLYFPIESKQLGFLIIWPGRKRMRYVTCAKKTFATHGKDDVDVCDEKHV